MLALLYAFTDALGPDENVVTEVHAQQQKHVEERDAHNSRPPHLFCCHGGQDTEEHQQEQQQDLYIAPDRDLGGRHHCELAIPENQTATAPENADLFVG